MKDVNRQSGEGELSNVDNYILLTSSIDEIDTPALMYLNRRLKEVNQGQLPQIDKHAGGHKYMEISVYVIATNHFHLTKMAELVSAAPWIRPEMVSLVHKGEEDEAFRLYHLNDLRRLVDKP